MTTEQMLKGGLRTVNLKLKVHKKLYLLKVEKDSESLSVLIDELIDFYIQKNKKLAIGK